MQDAHAYDPLLDAIPKRLSTAIDFNKVEGMLLGAAIGDSLSSDGLSAAERYRKYGEIKDYIHAANAPEFIY